MLGPIFNGSLVRENLQNMLTFKTDTMFEPLFIGGNYNNRFAY